MISIKHHLLSQINSWLDREQNKACLNQCARNIRGIFQSIITLKIIYRLGFCFHPNNDSPVGLEKP